MSRVTVLLDSVSISSSGTNTTSSVDVLSNENLVIYVEGDSNSTNLDITAEAKLRDVGSDSWAEHDSTITGEDLTTANNNARTFGYDVSNVTKIRFVIANNAGSSTTVTALTNDEA